MKIYNEDDFKSWLKDKPAAFAQVMAVRIALRVFPLIRTTKRNDITSASLRCLLISAVARHCPTPDMNLAAARATTYAQYDAARAANYTTYHAARAAYADNPSNDAAVATNAAARAAADTATYATYADNPSTGATYAVLSYDAIVLENSTQRPDEAAQALMLEPLWPKRGPEHLVILWAELKQNLISDHPSWAVWIDWHEQRLKGSEKPFSGYYDNWSEGPLTIALKGDEFWNRPAHEVNQDIISILRPKSIDDEDDAYGSIDETLHPNEINDFVIPPYEPAAIMPLITTEGITIDKSPHKVAVGAAIFQVSLQNLKKQQLELASTLKETNLDRRTAEGMETLAARIGDELPNLTDLFELAHGLETLKQLRPKVGEGSDA